MNCTHVVWDFNGTLLDDRDASLLAVNDMLEAKGKPVSDLETYYDQIEMPIIRYYEKLFDLETYPFDAIIRDFAEGYMRRAGTIKLGAGAMDALREFKRRGVRQVVISSFEQSRIEAWISKLGIEDYIDGVFGASDLMAESKTARAESWARASGAAPQNIVVVGDTEYDLEMAAAMGAGCVLVTYGHRGERRLRPFGVTLVDELSCLPDVLDRL